MNLTKITDDFYIDKANIVFVGRHAVVDTNIIVGFKSGLGKQIFTFQSKEIRDEVFEALISEVN